VLDEKCYLHQFKYWARG